MTRTHFLQPLRVPASAIDMNGHANNVEVVRWLQDVAMAHSAARGWPLQRYAQQGSTWVVRSHFVEYLRPAMQDDDLLLATWIARFDKNLSPRKTLVWRPRDRKLLARAETTWVFVDAVSGRARDIPQDFIDAFDAADEERPALQALRAWAPAQ